MTTRTVRPPAPQRAHPVPPGRRRVPVRTGVLAVVATAVLVSAGFALPSMLALVPDAPRAEPGSGREVVDPHPDPGVGVDAPDEARLNEDTIDPLDDTHPAIAGLDADLRTALQAVARDAHERGVDLWVTSGRRTAAMQQELLDAAVRKHGSLEEARRFVATPEGSSHVTGKAVDIGPTDGADWVVRHGADYGLCQTYANEMWHFELATTPGGECPAPLPDAG